MGVGWVGVGCVVVNNVGGVRMNFVNMHAYIPPMTAFRKKYGFSSLDCDERYKGCLLLDLLLLLLLLHR